MTTRLPVEILIAIVEGVDEVRHLWHVRTASHSLCAVATPIAFRVLSVITTRESARNLGRLFDIPDIAAHVREVAYHDTGADRRGRTLKYGASTPHSINDTVSRLVSVHPRWRVTLVRTSAIQELASSLSRVRQLPQLETINLTFNPAYNNRLNFDGGGRLALQTSILDALKTSFSIRTPPKLISLSLHNLRISNLPPFESPSFQTVLATVRRLQLSVLFDCPPDTCTFSACWRLFWGTFLPRMVLSPTQHALTELTLHSDEHVGASSGMSLAGLHFPHLCTLSLRKLVFEPSVGIEDFVLRHAATLAQLELIACKLPIDGDIFSSTSVALAKDEESKRRPAYWEDILDSFAAELTSLVALHVDGRNHSLWDPPGPECRYVQLGHGMSFLEIDALGPQSAADLAALRRFHTTVAARSEETRRES